MAITKRFNFDTPSTLEFGQVNSGFAKVKLSVMTDEQIANGTHFKKEVINQNLSTINYIPVVAEYKEEIGDFNTHGGKIEISDDGIKFIETTKPYGVVIADTAKWEEVKLKNGETVQYVTCFAYLWIDRYPELQVLYEGKSNNQSMEVSVEEAHFNEDTWVYEIDKFQFSALCLLGKSIQPAFDEAKVSVDYSKQDFKADYTEMLSALNIYLKNNNMEVFSLEENIKEDVVETTEEFEEIQDETLETEIVNEFEEETETEQVENTETEEDESEEEFTEEVEDGVDENAIDYEKLYNDLKIEYDKLVEQNSELNNFKQTIIKEEKEEMFNAFSNKLTSEEMQPVKDEMDILEVKDIEIQLFALVGKKADEGKLNFDKKGITKVGIFENNESDMSDGLRAVISRKRK